MWNFSQPKPVAISVTFYIMSHTFTASFQVSAHWCGAREENWKWFESHEHHDIVGGLACFIYLYCWVFPSGGILCSTEAPLHTAVRRRRRRRLCSFQCPFKVPELRTFSNMFQHKHDLPTVFTVLVRRERLSEQSFLYPVAVANVIKAWLLFAPLFLTP